MVRLPAKFPKLNHLPFFCYESKTHFPLQNISWIRSFIVCFACRVSAQVSNTGLSSFSAADIRSRLSLVADWQLEHPNDSVGLRWWHMAPFYDGLLALAEVTGEARYLSAVMEKGEQSGWALGDRFYHADDHAVGHAWLDIFAMDPSRGDRLQWVQKRMDEVLANPVSKTLRFGVDGYPEVTDRWSWCDALYMAPPTLAKLYAITGNAKYVRFMDHEYRWTYDELWDEKAGLFYRDARFPGQLTENGLKIFWSRGNGWVYGGLPMILDALPENDVSRSFYEKLFVRMSEAVAAAQQVDGLWRPNLADAAQVPTGESSGSGFFLYGIAWGIRNGLLPEDAYESVLVKGWQGLMTRIQPQGYIGYVQPVGFDPQNNIEASSTHVYGAGAFLLAGTEILKLMGAASERSVESLYAEAASVLESGNWVPNAGGYVVPNRVDDLAWENDKIAFRVYGPALRDSAENSGVDVWSKRVDVPVVYKWYQGSFDGSINYHEDTGEGFDGYKVGPARGCGGTGLLFEGKLYTANVYQRGSVMYTGPEKVELLFEYHYDIDGQRVRELKTVELGMGTQLCTATSEFRGSANLLAKCQFVIGLTPQTEAPVVRQQPGSIALWEPLGGFEIGTAVVMDLPGDELASVEYLELEDSKDVMLTIPLNEERTLHYRFGYAWTANSGIESMDQWMSYLAE